MNLIPYISTWTILALAVVFIAIYRVRVARRDDRQQSGKSFLQSAMRFNNGDFFARMRRGRSHHPAIADRIAQRLQLVGIDGGRLDIDLEIAGNMHIAGA